jgi:polysaccharide export outer membrane protein
MTNLKRQKSNVKSPSPSPLRAFDLSFMKKIYLIAGLCILGCTTSNVASAQNAPQPATSATASPTGALDQMGVAAYLLGTGDILDVRVYGEPNFSSVVEVDDRGNVQIPFVDPIPARCRTDQDVKKDIALALSKYLRDPQISVRIVERKSRPPATVFGAVSTPQRVQMLRRVRLLELIAVSGGLTEKAGRTLQVFHTGPEMCVEPASVATSSTIDDGLNVPFQVYQIADLKLGKEEANPFIRPGDIIIVQEAPPVYVTGSVVSPQGIYLRDRLFLTRAIAMVGGLKKDAKDQIRIYRQSPGKQEQEIISVDFDAIKKQKKPDIELLAYDVIEVGEASPFSSKRLGSTLLGIASGGLQNMGSGLPTRVLY